MDDFDIVSDLADGTADYTVSTHANDVQHGGDALDVNNQRPKQQDTVPEPKRVDDPAPEPKPQSLRDQLTNAIKGEAADTPAAASQDGQPRAPNGQFAPKPVEGEQPADTPASAPVVAAPQGIDPTVFASLPAETQASLARTMEDVATQQQRIAWLSPLEQVITQERINAWAMAGGMQPAQAIHQLLALSDFAGRDTAGFIKYIAQENGVDLEELVLGMLDGDGGETVDPQIKALQDQIAELQGYQTRTTQEQQQAAHNRTVDEVIAFASEKGPDGKTLLRPYFEELGQSIMPYISMVKSQNPNWPSGQVLQEAYDRACWATPSVRDKMQKAVGETAEAERVRAEAERVARARSASASVRPGVPSAPPAAPNDPSRSLRDTISAAVAAHTPS